MKRVRELTRKIFSFCMVAVLALGMLVVPAEKTAAATINEKIQDAKEAVVGIMVAVQNPLGDWQDVCTGTGFLIGTEADAQYVVTNDHVAHATSWEWLQQDEELQYRVVEVSRETEYTKIKSKVRIVLKRDSYIDTTIVQSSFDADLAILKLDQPIHNRKPIALDPDSELQTTQQVYALGFPAAVQNVQTDQIYTSDKVTVEGGTISQISENYGPNGSPLKYINHSAAISGGNSGGPLLNEEGNVIGVNERHLSTEGGATTYYYAIQIKEVTDLLDAMGIDYMKAGESGPEPTPTESSVVSSSVVEPEESAATEASEVDNSAAIAALMDDLGETIEEAKKIDTAKSTDESAEALAAAISSAEAVQKMGDLATEDEIQKAMADLKTAENGLVEKSGPNMGLIIAIIAVAIVLIVVVVLLVVMNGKKKKEQEMDAKKAAAARQQAKEISQGGFQQNVGFTPRDTSSYRTDDGSTPTGVLNEGSSATTVLGNSAVPTATLIRKKTGEKVTINKAAFKIGKERRKVDYCISDNTNISRTHADIVYKNGSFYIVDNNATNGTSVNGAKVPAGQEKALTGNETIRLADEEFLFRC